MATNNFANDSDSQRITLLNQRVIAYGQIVVSDSNGSNDRALGMLSANTAILLDQKGTRTNP
jgi:hypothetical protein